MHFSGNKRNKKWGYQELQDVCPKKAIGERVSSKHAQINKPLHLRHLRFPFDFTPLFMDWLCSLPFYLRRSILLPRFSTLPLNPFTISRICCTLSNSTSSSSICRKISWNRAISASAFAIVALADKACVRVEDWVCAVSCGRKNTS